MFRRPMFFLPVLLAAIALPAGQAFAGEEDPTSPDPGSAPGAVSASLSASKGCASGNFAKTAVSGDSIDSVAFYVDGKLVKNVTSANANGRYAFAMRCARLSSGVHRGRAVVTFAAGSSPASQTLRFSITRSRSPRFAG